MCCKHRGTLNTVPCVVRNEHRHHCTRAQLDVSVCEPTNLDRYTGMLCIPNLNTSFVQAHAQFWDLSMNT